MNLITIVIIAFLVLEATNVLTLYFFPGSKYANGVGVFKAWEKSKGDPEIHNFVKYLVNWVAGTKLIFILLLIVILYTADEQSLVLTSVALIISIASFFWRLFPLIRRMDRDNQIDPKNYSVVIGWMILVFYPGVLNGCNNLSNSINTWAIKEFLMQNESHIPKFVSIAAIALGCLDIMRGFMHTVLLDFAATNIAGFDLTTSLAGDLLQQMGAFGISNYLTGIMLILIGWKARPLALIMLGFIPIAYAIGIVGIKFNSAPYAPSQAAWGGTTFMLVYLAICVITFIAGVWITLYRKKKEDVIVQA